MKSLDQIYREMGINWEDPPGYSHGLYIGFHSGNFHPNNGPAVWCNPNHPKYGQKTTMASNSNISDLIRQNENIKLLEIVVYVGRTR